jgi:hypothetical protein
MSFTYTIFLTSAQASAIMSELPNCQMYRCHDPLQPAPIQRTAVSSTPGPAALLQSWTANETLVTIARMHPAAENKTTEQE